MGVIKQTAATVYRDFSTEGVQASGEHEPQKGDIRALFELVENTIGTSALGSLLSAKFTTLAVANAGSGSLNYPAGAVALIYADTANDLAVKSGASGSGSWALTSVVRDLISGLAQPYVTAAETAATTLTDPEGPLGDVRAALFGLLNTAVLIGQDVPVNKAYDAGTGTFIYNTPVPSDGYLTFVKLWARATGTVTVSRYRKVGGSYVKQSTGSKVLTITATGARSFTPSDFGRVELKAGDYLGISIPVTGTLTFSSGTKNGYSFSGTVNASTVPVETNTIDFAVGFGVPSADITRAGLLAAIGGSSGGGATGSSITLPYKINGDCVPSTGIASGGASLVFGVPASEDGLLVSARHYAEAAGNVEIGVYNRSGNTFTRVAYVTRAVTTGASDVAIGLPILAGQYVGLSWATTGAVTIIAKAWPTGYYIGAPASEFTDADGLLSTSGEIQTVFNLTYTRAVVETDLVKMPVTIKGSDRIVIFGDSYSGSYYAPRGKGWVPKLSMWTDYNVENFAITGDTFGSQLDKLRAGNAPYGGLPANQLGGTYGFIMLGQNNRNIGIARATEEARLLIQGVRAAGMIPVFSTEWLAVFGAAGQLLWKTMAENEGAIFLDLLPNTLMTNYGTIYAGFFGAGHPGVRTSDIIANPVIEFVKSLPAPRQSVKIFRKRTGVSVSSVADLMIDSAFDRNKLFREINVGQYAMTVATENYYDTLQDTSQGPYNYSDNVPSEYQSLVIGGSVSFADYALMEVTLPASQKDLQLIEIGLSAAGVSLWYRSMVDGALPASGKPLGVWHPLTATDGVFTMTRKDIEAGVRYDKVQLLLYKSGGFSMKEPVINAYGRQGKTLPPQRPRVRRATGTALIGNPDLGSLTGWTSVGTIATGTPADGMLPRGASGRVTVGTSNKIKRTLTYTQDDYADREVEIRVVCRRFPAIFNPAGDYATAPITQDSFDWTQINVELISADVDYFSGNVCTYVQKGIVGLWWKEVVIRALLPLGTTSIDLQISAESNVEVAKVEAVILGGANETWG